METYQKRVVQELFELEEKLQLLSKFIKESDEFKLLSSIEAGLMFSQVAMMSAYAEILKQRIELFNA